MNKELKDTDEIIVCDKCYRACCWHGYDMCDNSRSAGTAVLTVEELRRLDLEHESYWSEPNE